MAWRKYTNVAQDRSGSVVSLARIIVDYHSDENSEPRKAGILEVKDYILGTGNSITLNPADATQTQITEGVEFTAENDNADTADNIASAVEGVSGFSAKSKTGGSGNPWVSVYYSPSTITSLVSDDTAAWDFYTISSTNGTIMALAKDGTGTIKHQPTWTDSDGFFWAYIDRPTYVDIESHKSGKPSDDSRTEDIYLP